MLTKEEGGRHTPFFNGYRPQFYFRTTDVTGVATLPAGTEMVMPGDNVTLEIELITPIAMEKGLRFRHPRRRPHRGRRHGGGNHKVSCQRSALSFQLKAEGLCGHELYSPQSLEQLKVDATVSYANEQSDARNHYFAMR